MSVPWIHCNICMRLPSASNSRYFISNCGHVACARCVEKKLIAPKCTICKRDCKVEEINNKLREDLRKYFVNLHDYAVKAFKEVKSIIDFQSKNCRRLMKHKMEEIAKLQKAVTKTSEDATTIARLQQQVNELMAKNRELENENKNLNSSFLNQQSLFQKVFTGSAANSVMNATPSFFQPSINGSNVTQQDLFSLVNASYLNASATLPSRPAEVNLQESIIMPHVLAEQSSIQSSLNFDMASSLNSTLPMQRASSTAPLRPVQQQIPAGFKTPSRVPPPHQFSSVGPSQRLAVTPAHRSSTGSSHLTSSAAAAGPSHRTSSTGSSSRTSSTGRIIAAATPSFLSTSKLNQSSRSWNDSTMLSVRTTQSAPSRSGLYKPPVVTVNSAFNLRTPQPTSRPSRSRTVCPHWPRSRCRCHK